MKIELNDEAEFSVTIICITLILIVGIMFSGPNVPQLQLKEGATEEVQLEAIRAWEEAVKAMNE